MQTPQLAFTAHGNKILRMDWTLSTPLKLTIRRVLSFTCLFSIPPSDHLFFPTTSNIHHPSYIYLVPHIFLLQFNPPSALRNLCCPFPHSSLLPIITLLYHHLPTSLHFDLHCPHFHHFHPTVHVLFPLVPLISFLHTSFHLSPSSPFSTHLSVSLPRPYLLLGYALLTSILTEIMTSDIPCLPSPLLSLSTPPP